MWRGKEIGSSVVHHDCLNFMRLHKKHVQKTACMICVWDPSSDPRVCASNTLAKVTSGFPTQPSWTAIARVVMEHKASRGVLLNCVTCMIASIGEGLKTSGEVSMVPHNHGQSLSPDSAFHLSTLLFPSRKSQFWGVGVSALGSFCILNRLPSLVWLSACFRLQWFQTFHSSVLGDFGLCLLEFSIRAAPVSQYIYWRTKQQETEGLGSSSKANC